MAGMAEVQRESLYMGRLSHGADLLEELTRICRQREIASGRIEAIGAVSKACIGYYDQSMRVYRYTTLDAPMEILKLSGNVSLKDGEPMVHAHITLADSEGRACGGHLAAGTQVFACECIIEDFRGGDFKREFDEETGLSLWAL
jgi:predicted DNA-binding protein with PD1-like motif